MFNFLVFYNMFSVENALKIWYLKNVPERLKSDNRDEIQHQSSISLTPAWCRPGSEFQLDFGLGGTRTNIYLFYVAWSYHWVSVSPPFLAYGILTAILKLLQLTNHFFEAFAANLRIDHDTLVCRGTKFENHCTELSTITPNLAKIPA
jgi:hypothetical protein